MDVKKETIETKLRLLKTFIVEEDKKCFLQKNEKQCIILNAITPCKVRVDIRFNSCVC